MPAPKGARLATYVTKEVMGAKEEIDDELELESKREAMAKKFDAKMLARSYTKEAIAVLVAVMNSTKASNTDRITAAKALLERGHGRAPLMAEDAAGIKMPVIFLPVEMNEEKQAITVQALTAHEPAMTPEGKPFKHRNMDSRWEEERQLEEALDDD